MKSRVQTPLPPKQEEEDGTVGLSQMPDCSENNIDQQLASLIKYVKKRKPTKWKQSTQMRMYLY
jgi:hypothetical protein